MLFIMMSNASEEFYPQIGYGQILSRYQKNLNGMVGPTRVMVCGKESEA